MKIFLVPNTCFPKVKKKRKIIYLISRKNRSKKQKIVLLINGPIYIIDQIKYVYNSCDIIWLIPDSKYEIDYLKYKKIKFLYSSIEKLYCYLYECSLSN